MSNTLKAIWAMVILCWFIMIICMALDKVGDNFIILWGVTFALFFIGVIGWLEEQ